MKQIDMTGSASVANTIYQQLGGRRFAVMTGARDFISFLDGLSFKLPRNTTRNRIGGVTITLTEKDTYKVEFVRIGILTVEPVETFDDVYAENLQTIFTKTTGLDTHL